VKQMCIDHYSSLIDAADSTSVWNKNSEKYSGSVAFLDHNSQKLVSVSYPLDIYTAQTWYYKTHIKALKRLC